MQDFDKHFDRANNRIIINNVYFVSKLLNIRLLFKWVNGLKYFIIRAYKLI